MSKQAKYTGRLSEQMINKEYKKGYSRILSMQENELFLVEYKGFKFNVLPFLINATGFYPTSYTNAIACEVASRVDEICYANVTELMKCDGLNLDVLETLSPCYSGYKELYLTVYLYYLDKKAAASLLYMGAMYAFKSTVVEGRADYIIFNTSSICNTQAFSYYISLLWFLKISPNLKAFFAKDLRKLNLVELLEKFLPENSIHYRYISGELTGEQLRDEYHRRDRPDGSSVAVRELMHLESEGTYDDGILDVDKLAILKDMYNLLHPDFEYNLNASISFCFVHKGTYNKLYSEKESLYEEIDLIKEQNARLNDKLRAVREEVVDLKNDIKKKDNQIKDLFIDMKRYKSNEELQNRVDELESTIRKKDSEFDSLFKDNLELKRVISTQKKQLRNINQSSVDLLDVDCENYSTDEELEKVTIEEMACRIKDKKILLVGADFISSFTQKFEQYGISNVAWFDRNSKSIGYCDYGVIMCNRCSHSDVFRLEKLCKGTDTEIIYFSGSNIEQLIETIYQIDLDNAE